MIIWLCQGRSGRPAGVLHQVIAVGLVADAFTLGGVAAWFDRAASAAPASSAATSPLIQRTQEAARVVGALRFLAQSSPGALAEWVTGGRANLGGGDGLATGRAGLGGRE